MSQSPPNFWAQQRWGGRSLGEEGPRSRFIYPGGHRVNEVSRRTLRRSKGGGTNEGWEGQSREDKFVRVEESRSFWGKGVGEARNLVLELVKKGKEKLYTA